MLLSVLLQAAAAGVGVSKLGAAWVLVWLLSVQVWVLARLVVLPWKHCTPAGSIGRYSYEHDYCRRLD